MGEIPHNEPDTVPEKLVAENLGGREMANNAVTNAFADKYPDLIMRVPTERGPVACFYVDEERDKGVVVFSREGVAIISTLRKEERDERILAELAQDEKSVREFAAPVETSIHDYNYEGVEKQTATLFSASDDKSVDVEIKVPHGRGQFDLDYIKWHLDKTRAERNSQ